MPDKKMGRPLSDNPKGVKITVRFDNTTNAELEEYCSSTGLTKAEVLRQGFYKLRDENK